MFITRCEFRQFDNINVSNTTTILVFYEEIFKNFLIQLNIRIISIKNFKLIKNQILKTKFKNNYFVCL